MAGLLDEDGKLSSDAENVAKKAHRVWEESMLKSIQTLKDSILTESLGQIAFRCKAHHEKGSLHFQYWSDTIVIEWPTLEMIDAGGQPVSTFDKAMLMYYLDMADGTKMADRWIGFRELPNGAFYNQAFQGYTGDRLARSFGNVPEQFNTAARKSEGLQLPSLADHAFAFQPLPCVRLAAVLWPGDDEFPSKASVLFDASSCHYLPTDGLAILGSGLVRRLEKQRS